MHTLTIKLKQHTPLIHFQHDQDGATLRASEVKPKLDKYLSKYAFHDSFDECKMYLVGYVSDPMKIKELQEKWNNGYRALNYKISITSSCKESKKFNYEKIDSNGEPVLNEKNKPVFDRIPLYFGNLTKEKSLVFDGSEDIKLEFFSLNDTIINKIKENYLDFFATTNFGTRQSKGFGSFYPSDVVLVKEMFDQYYYYTTTVNVDDWWHKSLDLFTKIDYFYKSLRSGINQGFYFKSLMFHYAIEQKQYYDKRKIRQFYKHFKPNKEDDKGENDEKKKRRPWSVELSKKSRLYRDMLGLSTNQEWKFYHATVKKESAQVRDEDRINRFKSPLTFKPLYLNDGSVIVLVIPSTIPDRYKGHEFILVSQWDHNKENKKFIGENEGKPMPPMSTPEKFDIHDFLSYVFKGRGKAIALEQLKNQKSSIAKKLTSIYNKMHCPSI